MFNEFCEEARKVMVSAKEEMYELKHPYVGSEHLLLAILKNENDVSKKLKEYKLTYESLKKEIINVIGIGTNPSKWFLYTPLLKRVIENSIIDSKENNNGIVTVEHLFLGILEEGEGVAIRILLGMNIDIDELYQDFAYKIVNTSKCKKNRKLLVDELGYDLNKKARDGCFDPVVGRDKEIQRLLEILCRRTKNNPILIGDAGVGKTAIVEELSRLIANDEVPRALCDKKIISLDMATMVAGTKYRGEFEERMKKVIKEIEDNDDIILFIDEIHTLVGAGGAEGAIDASNILKPALARGKIRCIGATTTEEYKKFIEKDSALERRFQKIFVNEPTIGETKNILMKIKNIYERYHNVIIDNNMIDYIINLSEKYIFDRNRPDKEIDILDEVASRVGLRGCTSDNEVRDIKREICKLNKDKNSFIIDNNIDKAYSLRKKETELMSRLNDIELLSKNNKNKILLDDIASVISNRTGVPIYEIISNSGNVDDMENRLKDIIIGENKAIDNLMDITKRIKCGYNDRCYSLLFVGSSGVGKSRLAKEYANILVGADNLIRMDMSEYSDSTAVNKILGSSPGYVGYDDNKNILEEIRNKPNSVLLLDEIDKAHPNVINLFYQILEEGKIKNSKGREVRFNNVVVIMTSNIGFEKNGIGFNKKADSSVISSLKGYFNTAFINRIDNIIVFDRLEETSIKCIIKKRFECIRDKYKDINIDINDNVIDEIVNKCEFYEFGARRIDKIISKDIENVIIDGVIRGDKNIYIDSIAKKNITS